MGHVAIFTVVSGIRCGDGYRRERSKRKGDTGTVTVGHQTMLNGGNAGL